MSVYQKLHELHQPCAKLWPAGQLKIWLGSWSCKIFWLLVTVCTLPIAHWLLSNIAMGIINLLQSLERLDGQHALLRSLQGTGSKCLL